MVTWKSSAGADLLVVVARQRELQAKRSVDQIVLYTTKLSIVGILSQGVLHHHQSISKISHQYHKREMGNRDVHARAKRHQGMQDIEEHSQNTTLRVQS